MRTIVPSLDLGKTNPTLTRRLRRADLGSRRGDGPSPARIAPARRTQRRATTRRWDDLGSEGHPGLRRGGHDGRHCRPTPGPISPPLCSRARVVGQHTISPRPHFAPASRDDLPIHPGRAPSSGSGPSAGSSYSFGIRHVAPGRAAFERRMARPSPGRGATPGGKRTRCPRLVSGGTNRGHHPATPGPRRTQSPRGRRTPAASLHLRGRGGRANTRSRRSLVFARPPGGARDSPRASEPGGVADDAAEDPGGRASSVGLLRGFAGSVQARRVDEAAMIVPVVEGVADERSSQLHIRSPVEPLGPALAGAKT